MATPFGWPFSCRWLFWWLLVFPVAVSRVLCRRSTQPRSGDAPATNGRIGPSSESSCAHQLLYRFQRDSRHDQSAGKCVAETMPTEIPDLGFQHPILKPAPVRFPDQRLFVIGKEHLFCMAGDQKLPLEGCQRRRVQGNDPARSVLCLQQLNPLPFQIHLIPGERKLL